MKQYEIDVLVKNIIHEMDHKNPKGEFHSKSGKDKPSEAKLRGVPMAVTAAVTREHGMAYHPSREDVL